MEESVIRRPASCKSKGPDSACAVNGGTVCLTQTESPPADALHASYLSSTLKTKEVKKSGRYHDERMWRLPREKSGFSTSRLRTILSDTLTSFNRRPPPGRKWTLHCIRVGPASECNALGIPLSRIRRQGGWTAKSDVPSKKYIDPSCPPSTAGRRFFDWLTPDGHLRRLGAA